MKRYTENEINEAIERKDALRAMLRKMESLIDDAIDNDLPNVEIMIQDLMADVETELDEVDEIVSYGYRQQFDEQMLEYMAAV